MRRKLLRDYELCLSFLSPLPPVSVPGLAWTPYCHTNLPLHPQQGWGSIQLSLHYGHVLGNPDSSAFPRKSWRATGTPQKSFWHRSSRLCRCLTPFYLRINCPSAKAENSTSWPYSVGSGSLLGVFEHLHTKVQRVVWDLRQTVELDCHLW